MQVSIEASEGLNRKLKVTIPAADYKKNEQSVIRSFSNNRRVPGFRKGKVPTNVLLKEYGFEMKQQVINGMIQNTLQLALIQSDIKNVAASTPVVGDITDTGSDNDFSYVVEVEVNPEVDFSTDLSAVEFKKVVCSIGDEDLNNMIETLRKQQGKWTEAAEGSEAQDGNLVNIDFEGFKDGVAFENGKASNYGVVLGDKRMIPGFEDQIKGHKVNDEFEINVTFPAEYQAKELAGQPVVFKAKLLKISTLQLPEVNEDFIKVLGVKGSIDDFRAEVRKNMERQLQFSLEKLNQKEVFDKLMAQYGANLELPARLVAENIQYIKENAAQRKQTVTDEQAKSAAESRIKSAVIFDAITKKLDVKFDESRVDAFIDSLASAYEDAEEYKKAIKSNANQLNNIRQNIFTEQVTEAVLAAGKTSEENKPFSEVVNNPYFY